MLINELYQTPAQLDELSWKDVQRGAERLTKRVARTGQRVGDAATAVGGAAKEIGKQFVAKPTAAAYRAAKGGLGAAADTAKGVYGDVKKGLGTAAKGVSQATSDLGRAGAWAGKELGKAAKGAGTAIGAVAGAPQGIGRAIKKGYAGSVQAIGGAPVPADDQQADAAATASASKQIRTQSGAINPATGRAWTPDELRTYQHYRQSTAAAAPQPAAPAVPPAAPAASSVTVRQINQQIPTVRTRDLASIKRTVDATLAKRKQPTAGTASTGTPSFLAPSGAKSAKPPTMTIGGQKIRPTDPAYGKIAKRMPAPVSETVNRILQMVKTAQSQDDVRVIKEFIDRDFARRGVVSDQVFHLRDRLIESVTATVAQQIPITAPSP